MHKTYHWLRLRFRRLQQRCIEVEFAQKVAGNIERKIRNVKDLLHDVVWRRDANDTLQSHGCFLGSAVLDQGVDLGSAVTCIS